MDGSVSNGMPGGTIRRGPSHCTGNARALHIGSVSRLNPPIWIRNVACPTHVRVSVSRPARGAGNAGARRGNADGWGAGGRRLASRSTSIQRSRPPSRAGPAPSSHGLRKPPPGRWCGGRGRVTGLKETPPRPKRNGTRRRAGGVVLGRRSDISAERSLYPDRRSAGLALAGRVHGPDSRSATEHAIVTALAARIQIKHRRVGG